MAVCLSGEVTTPRVTHITSLVVHAENDYDCPSVIDVENDCDSNYG